MSTNIDASWYPKLSPTFPNFQILFGKFRCPVCPDFLSFFPLLLKDFVHRKRSQEQGGKGTPWILKFFISYYIYSKIRLFS